MQFFESLSLVCRMRRSMFAPETNIRRSICLLVLDDPNSCKRTSNFHEPNSPSLVHLMKSLMPGLGLGGGNMLSNLRSFIIFDQERA